MLQSVQNIIPLPQGSSGLALEGTTLRVLGVDAATAQTYLDQVRVAWADIVRADARAKVEQQGRALIRKHMLQLEQAQAQVVKDEMSAALAMIDAATTVAEINALQLPAWARIGIPGPEPDTWQPYPETCPWTLAKP